MEHDVLIIGSGPAGCVLALELARKGVRVAILEKDEFPRFHIGESLTGECAEHLRALGIAPHMAGWPVKNGVMVYGREAKNHFWVPVAARDRQGDIELKPTWQVRRSDFDLMLQSVAREAGATILRGEALSVLRDGERVTGVRLEGRDLTARVVVDASGLHTFFAREGVVGPKSRGRYANQTAVFSQVKNTVREPARFDDTFIFYGNKHHWGWFIPLDREVVSVGVVTPVDYLKESRTKHGSLDGHLLNELEVLNPELARRVPDRTFLEPVRTISNYSYRVEKFTGPNFLCVGDAHRFLDPIFSFGVTFAISEARFAARSIVRHLQDGSGFDDFQAFSDRGQAVIADMIDFFWERPYWFALLVNGKDREEFLDYFAGRIYGETERDGLRTMRDFLTKYRAGAFGGGSADAVAG